MARALELSTSTAAPSVFSDPSFASSLLSSADPNDPLVQAALAQLQANQPPPPPGNNEEDATGKKRKGDEK